MKTIYSLEANGREIHYRSGKQFVDAQCVMKCFLIAYKARRYDVDVKNNTFDEYEIDPMTGAARIVMQNCTITLGYAMRFGLKY